MRKSIIAIATATAMMPSGAWAGRNLDKWVTSDRRRAQYSVGVKAVASDYIASPSLMVECKREPITARCYTLMKEANDIVTQKMNKCLTSIGATK